MQTQLEPQFEQSSTGDKRGYLNINRVSQDIKKSQFTQLNIIIVLLYYDCICDYVKKVLSCEVIREKSTLKCFSQKIDKYEKMQCHFFQIIQIKLCKKQG